jgi:phosphoadenosine phosphosulfate reductase
MLIENTLLGTIDKVQIAIDRLKQFEPPEGYYLAFSGGKDSQCIYELAKMSGVKFDAHFNFTTVDPPEVLKFIKQYYPDVIWERPEKTMWELMEEKMMPPTRMVRYCCEYLKERGGAGRFVVIGVRRAESVKRKDRSVVENCAKQNKRLLSPIVDWTEKDVWDFVKLENLPYCSLYDEGYKRIGCVLCPMQTLRMKKIDIERYPNFVKAYKKAISKMLGNCSAKSKLNNWNYDVEECFNWWIYGKKSKDDTLFEEEQIFNYE